MDIYRKHMLKMDLINKIAPLIKNISLALHCLQQIGYKRITGTNGLNSEQHSEGFSIYASLSECFIKTSTNM